LRRRPDYVITFWYRAIAPAFVCGIWWLTSVYLTRSSTLVGNDLRSQFFFVAMSGLAVAAHISGGVVGLVSFDIHESLRLIFANARAQAAEEDTLGVRTIMGVWWGRVTEIGTIASAP